MNFFAPRKKRTNSNDDVEFAALLEMIHCFYEQKLHTDLCYCELMKALHNKKQETTKIFVECDWSTVDEITCEKLAAEESELLQQEKMMRVCYECHLKLPIEEKKARVCRDIKKCKELHLIRKKVISMYPKIDSHYQGLIEYNVWLKKTTAKPVAVPHTADIADATDIADTAMIRIGNDDTTTDIADTAMIRIGNDDTSTTIAMEVDDICHSNRAKLAECDRKRVVCPAGSKGVGITKENPVTNAKLKTLRSRKHTVKGQCVDLSKEPYIVEEARLKCKVCGKFLTMTNCKLHALTELHTKN